MNSSDDKKTDDYYYKKLIDIKEASSRNISVKVIRTRVSGFATYYDCGKCNRSIYIVDEVNNNEKGFNNSKFCSHCGQRLEDNWYKDYNE